MTLTRVQFSVLLMGAVAASNVLTFIGTALAQCLDIVNPHVLAWFLISLTYAGFIAGEKLFGATTGWTRDIAARWPPLRLYAAVFTALSPAALGLGALAPTLEPTWLVRALAPALVMGHFLLRRRFTEDKGTPHLGQQPGSSVDIAGDKWHETSLGLLSDFFLVLLYGVLFRLTGFPLWLFGAIALVFCYMPGVLLHRFLDREPKSFSSYLFVLVAMFIVITFIVVSSFLDPISPPNLIELVIAVAAPIVIGRYYSAELPALYYAIALLFGASALLTCIIHE